MNVNLMPRPQMLKCHFAIVQNIYLSWAGLTVFILSALL